MQRARFVSDSDEGDGDDDAAEYPEEAGEAGDGPPPPAPAPRRRPLDAKRKDALREFREFSKKMKLDAGLTIKTIAGGDVVELDELLSDSGDSDTDSSDGFSEGEFTVDPEAGLRPDQGDESFIDPETGDFVEPKKPASAPVPAPTPAPAPAPSPSPVLEEGEIPRRGLEEGEIPRHSSDGDSKSRDMDEEVSPYLLFYNSFCHEI